MSNKNLVVVLVSLGFSGLGVLGVLFGVGAFMARSELPPPDTSTDSAEVGSQVCGPPDA